MGKREFVENSRGFVGKAAALCHCHNYPADVSHRGYD